MVSGFNHWYFRSKWPTALGSEVCNKLYYWQPGSPPWRPWSPAWWSLQAGWNKIPTLTDISLEAPLIQHPIFISPREPREPIELGRQVTLGAQNTRDPSTLGSPDLLWYIIIFVPNQASNTLDPITYPTLYICNSIWRKIKKKKTDISLSLLTTKHCTLHWFSGAQSTWDPMEPIELWSPVT